MGNRNNHTSGNRILIEFMTPQQKLKKDRIISKVQTEEKQAEDEDDVEIMDDFKKYYSVDFSKVVYTPENEVSFNNLFSSILKPTSDAPDDLLEITSFLNTQVKTYQIFFNNRELTTEDYTYNFKQQGSQPLNIEIIYKKKHWMERLYSKVRDVGNRMQRSLNLVSQVFSFTQPIYSTYRYIQPFVLPCITTLQYGFPGDTGKYTKPALAVLTFLANIAATTSKFSTPIISKATQLLPTSIGKNQVLIGLGMFFGKGIIWSTVKFSLLIFCPFLTPFFWIFGL